MWTKLEPKWPQLSPEIKIIRTHTDKNIFHLCLILIKLKKCITMLYNSHNNNKITYVIPRASCAKISIVHVHKRSRKTDP